MKALKPFLSLLFIAVVALVIAAVTGTNPLYSFMFLFGASCVPMPKGTLNMALQKEIWAKDIIDNLYKDNQFALRAFNADPFVMMGKVVHIPVAGAPAQVKKNLNAFPQVAVGRNDSELTYAIDTYYALPRQIQDIDKYELSYDKRQSIVGEDEKQLIQTAMDGLLYRWAPADNTASNILLTDGNDTNADLIDNTAAGSRKTFTKNSLKAAAKKFATGNINDRLTALLTANHYHQFFDSLSDAEKTNFNNVADLKTGVVGRYMNIEILMRSSVLRYRGADIGHLALVDELDPAFAPTADDRAASLIWSANSVERAKGDVQVFDNPGQALYYGDVFSAMLRLGGRQRRAAGVIAVVEELGV